MRNLSSRTARACQNLRTQPLHQAYQYSSNCTVPQHDEKEPRRKQPVNKPYKKSLLNELFPESVAKTSTATARTEEEVPRLALNASRSHGREGRFTGSSQRRSTKELESALIETLKRQRHPKEAENEKEAQIVKEDLAVLVVQNAGKSQLESDFKRVAPRGKHIGGWRKEGDIIQVIPARDPDTLEQLPYYLVYFSSVSSAQAYQDHLNTLHSLANAKTTEDLDDETRQALQSYSLVPTSQKPVLRLLRYPFSERLLRIIVNRGYPQITSLDTTSDGVSNASGNKVMFSVHGCYSQPSLTQIRTAFAADARDQRGLKWRISDNGRAIHQLSDLPTLESTSANGDTSKARTNGSARPSWVIVFEDADEASRFRRRWHQRPFTRLGEVDEQADSSRDRTGIVKAEILW